jgi:hypothetical protein
LQVKLTPRIATMSGTLGARRSRSPLALAATLCASVALLLGVAAPAANAATPIDSYGYLTSFGDGGGFSFGQQNDAVAVDGGTGNIMFAETVDDFGGGVGAVHIYAPDSAAGGVPLTSADLPSLPLGIAVDQADGSLYIFSADIGLTRYHSDGAAVPTYTLDSSFAPSLSISTPIGIAVDPITHDVLIADFNDHRVYRIDPTGALISSFNGSDTSQGGFQRIGGLAVGPTGTTYVVDEMNDGKPSRVERFSPAGVSLGSLPIATGRAKTVAVNPQNGKVAVVVSRQDQQFNEIGQQFIEGFTASGQPAFTERIPAQAAGGPVGLAWDGGSDRLYLDVNIGNFTGTIHTFVPATQPGLDAPVISQIAPTGAHVEATIAPGGETDEETKARIEYCPATAKCADFPVSDPNPESGNPWIRLTDHEGLDGSGENGEETIAGDLAGLAPNTSYLVRSSADRRSADGVPTENTSASTTLHTLLVPPLVQTGLAGAVSDSQATLTGTIDTYGAQTTYHFEYGLDTNYGSSSPAGAEGVAGNSRTPRTFSRTIAGLQPGTTYHYRIVATNSTGTAAGSDRTFTTVGADEVAPGRAYEQVSPVDKRGASIATYGFQVAADGSAFEYTVAGASTDAASAPLQPHYISRRGSSDWLDWEPLDPPLNVTRQIVVSTVQAVSPDFSHALVASNRVLAPGGIENGGNLYVKDLRTGSYAFVGAASGLLAYLHMVSAATAYMYLDGSPDFSWVVLASRDPLLPGVTGPAMYKWTEAGGLELESYLPDGSVSTTAFFSLQGGIAVPIRQVSDDGNTMYFSFTGGAGGVYRRENGQTTAISVSQIPGDPTTPLPGEIDSTSRDGRFAIFRSGRLTPDAPAVPSYPFPANLYQYDSLSGDLTYLGTANSAEQGRVIGVSEDAQTVYFNDGSHIVVWRDGVLHTVTSEHPDSTTGGMVAFRSPNGRFLAYLGSDGDAHLYDADTQQTVCVSCRPDGSVGGTASLTTGHREISNRSPQAVTDDGAVFFTTAVPLVPADHNGTYDVYSYQGGQLTLISPGDGNFNARFADATPDGSSIFFTTAESLVGQDTDGELDVYDARVGGGFAAQSPPPPPASCARSECAEADSGPLSSPPFSSSQSQPSAKPRKHCPKGTHARKVKGKTRCVKPSKGKKKGKRANANTNRRQGR